MIITADLHLGLALDSTYDEYMVPLRFTATMIRLEKMLEVAKKEGMPLIIAGDLTETPHPKPYVLTGLMDLFFKYRSVWTYIIPGNHDAGWWNSVDPIRSARLDHVDVITEPEEREIEGKQTLFIPHPLKGRSWTKLATYKKKRWDLIISHAYAAGAVSVSEFYGSEERTMHIIPEQWDYKLMVLGHVHQYQLLENDVVYPGSVTMCDLGERNDEKGFLYLQKNLTSFVMFDDDMFRYKQIKIDLTNKDLGDVDKEKLAVAIKDALVKVVVVASDRLVVDEVAIRRLINKYGRVVRFSIITPDEKENVVQLPTPGNLVALLNEWVDAQSASIVIKTLAKKEGKRILMQLEKRL